MLASRSMAGKGVEEATLRGVLRDLCAQELITELTFETGDRKGQLGYRRKIATSTAEEAPAVEMKMLDARSIQQEIQKSSAAGARALPSPPLPSLFPNALLLCIPAPVILITCFVALAVGISSKPTIAIITAQYYEKLAIDAMMEHRQTFVRCAHLSVLVAC